MLGAKKDLGEKCNTTMRSKSLPSVEIFFYSLAWIIGIIYSTYQVYLTGNKLVNLYVSELPAGWSFTFRRKDNTDEEWRMWTRFIFFTISPWVLVHHIGARIVDKFCNKILPFWYIFVTSACIIYNYGRPAFFVLLAQPTMFYLLLHITRSRFTVWAFCFVASHGFTNEKYVEIYFLSDDDLKIVIPALMWIYLRCISFSMCIIEDRASLKDIFLFFGYVFYLPCFFLGPIYLYQDFSEQILGTKRKPSKTPLPLLILHNIRYLFWIFIMEYCLHYIYVHSLLDYIESFVQIGCENVWVMYGMGFFMGQFFFLKYTVVYGLALTWTRAEGYKTPDPPKCIAYVYLYSDMWREFDQPLYRFIKQHIYEPCFQDYFPKSYLINAFVSFLCFSFIYVWHGLDYSIFMWSFLNYCGVVVEMVARYVSTTEFYSLIQKKLSPQNERRLLGLLCAPFIIVSAISNFYFLGGTVVAETYFKFIFVRGTISTLLRLWFLLYVSCQVSMEIRARRKISNKTDQNSKLTYYKGL